MECKFFDLTLMPRIFSNSNKDNEQKTHELQFQCYLWIEENLMQIENCCILVTKHILVLLFTEDPKQKENCLLI